MYTARPLYNQRWSIVNMKKPRIHNARGIAKENVHVNIPIDIMDRLDRLAEKERRSRSNMICVLLERALDEG